MLVLPKDTLLGGLRRCEERGGRLYGRCKCWLWAACSWQMTVVNSGQIGRGPWGKGKHAPPEFTSPSETAAEALAAGRGRSVVPLRVTCFVFTGLGLRKRILLCKKGMRRMPGARGRPHAGPVSLKVPPSTRRAASDARQAPFLPTHGRPPGWRRPFVGCSNRLSGTEALAAPEGEEPLRNPQNSKWQRRFETSLMQRVLCNAPPGAASVPRPQRLLPSRGHRGQLWGLPVRKWLPLYAAGGGEFTRRVSTGEAQGGHCPAVATALEEVPGESPGEPGRLGARELHSTEETQHSHCYSFPIQALQHLLAEGKVCRLLPLHACPSPPCSNERFDSEAASYGCVTEGLAQISANRMPALGAYRQGADSPIDRPSFAASPQLASRNRADTARSHYGEWPVTQLGLAVITALGCVWRSFLWERSYSLCNLSPFSSDTSETEGCQREADSQTAVAEWEFPPLNGRALRDCAIGRPGSFAPVSRRHQALTRITRLKTDS
ncbi:hypothetical protein COCON_G00036340 [Conger conger]|uniref:Uncharacterized protein n=1 Tax=Conger conger TaxID=82655 RepID=A0A9Q1E0A3_CONCO|nr:hypothetical protein COCON_G00036340 [Conger conger]